MAKSIKILKEYKRVMGLGGVCYLCGENAVKRCRSCGRRVCSTHTKSVVDSDGHLSYFECVYCFRTGSAA